MLIVLKNAFFFSNFKYGFRSSSIQTDRLTVLSGKIIRAIEMSAATGAVTLDTLNVFSLLVVLTNSNLVWFLVSFSALFLTVMLQQILSSMLMTLLSTQNVTRLLISRNSWSWLWNWNQIFYTYLEGNLLEGWTMNDWLNVVLFKACYNSGYMIHFTLWYSVIHFVIHFDVIAHPSSFILHLDWGSFIVSIAKRSLGK